MAAAPEVVLSLDWQGVSASERDDDAAQSPNLGRQAGLISASTAAGARRFVGTGSQAEYGSLTGRVAESHPLKPLSAYGRAKAIAGEQLANSGLEWAWARIFSVFGPLETGAWLLPTIARAAASGDHIALSSGTQRWSYLFAADAARALTELVTQPAASGVYNVGHPDAPPLRESVAAFSEALGAEKLVVYGDEPGTPLEPDTSRLQSLGWSPQWTASRAMTVTAEWFRGAAVPDPFGSANLPTAPNSP